jgi:hypothetical protein
MVRTRALVVPAETVTPVTTLCRRSHRLFAVSSMRRRVNPYPVYVDVRPALNQLRFARRGRRRVCMNYQGCYESHRKYELRENFYVDSPCLNQCLTHPNLLECVVRSRTVPGQSPTREPLGPQPRRSQAAAIAVVRPSDRSRRNRRVISLRSIRRGPMFAASQVSDLIGSARRI